MNISFLKINQIIAFLSLASILNFGLLPDIAQANPTNKAVTKKTKISTLKHQDNRSIDLHLTLSRVIAEPADSQIFEQKDLLEISREEQTIPLHNQPLIARTFGGQASWYGPGFHGRLTANGERYNQNAMTAAHRHLRFGTRVRVTNLNNGRSVVVRINDRGPYIKGRVIDVSAAAARSLGMIKSGVAPVKVTILGR